MRAADERRGRERDTDREQRRRPSPAEWPRRVPLVRVRYGLSAFFGIISVLLLAPLARPQETRPASPAVDHGAVSEKTEPPIAIRTLIERIGRTRGSSAGDVADIDRDIRRVTADTTLREEDVDDLWIRFGLVIGREAPPSDRIVEILIEGRRRAERRRRTTEGVKLSALAGERLLLLRRHRDARDEFLVALRLAEEAGERSTVADLLFRIGTTESRLGNFASALEMYGKAEAAYRSINPGHYRLSTLDLFRSNTMSDAGDFDGALKCLDRAEEAFRPSYDAKRFEVIAQNRGRTYAAAGVIDRATIELAKFARSAHANGRLSDFVQSRQIVLDVLNRMNAARDTGAIIERSIAASTADAFAAGCDQIGRTFGALKDPGAAMAWFEHAEAIYRTIGRKESAAEMKRRRGFAYLDIRRHDLARSLFEDARKDFDSLGNIEARDQCEIDIIETYELIEDVATVMRLIDDVLPRYEATANRPVLTRLYLKKCRGLTHLGRFGDAEVVDRRLEPLVAESGSKTLKLEARIVRAYLDYRTGHVDRAAATFDAIAAERSAVGGVIENSEELLLRGIVFAAMGRLEDASASFIELSRVYRTQILGAASLSPEATRELRDKISRLPDYAVACLLEKSAPEAVNTDALYGMCQDLQARGILQQYLEREIEPREVLLTDEMRLERLRKKKAQAEARRREIEDAKTLGDSEAASVATEIAELDSSIKQSALDIERIESRRESPARRLFEREIGKPIAPSDIQGKIPRNSALLEFCGAYYPPVAWVWVSTSTSRRMIKLAEPHEIFDAIVAANRSFALGEPGVATAQLRDLGRRIMDPVLAALRDMGVTKDRTTLLIATTDAFGFVPFEALLTDDPAAGADGSSHSDLPYLIRDFDVAYVPSGSMLFAMAKRGPRPPSDGPAFVGFGFPFDYDAEKSGLTSDELALLKPPIDRSDDVDRYGLRRIPGTAIEVLSCARLFAATEKEKAELTEAASMFRDERKSYPRDGKRIRGTGFSVYLRSSATESAVKGDRDVRTAEVVHFACHGQVDYMTPANSALRLTMSRIAENSTGDNGLLSIGELRNLDLEADLLILSACKTAGGAHSKGDGIVSLAVAGLASGARSVVATRYAIDDQDSAQLMTRFYENWKLHGMSRIHALSEAKRSAIHEGKQLRTWAAYQIFDVRID